MTQIWEDVRFGLRLLGRSRGFTSVAVLALALGIGASTAIFSVVYATLLAPLPYADPDRLVMVWSKTKGDRSGTAVANFRDWKNLSSSFQALNGWTSRRVALSTGDRPESVPAAVTTPGFVTMHGHRFAFGRDFLPEEAEPGRDRVLILTHRLWARRFNSEATVVGRTVRVDGKPFTVVGVLEAGPADRSPSEAFLPLAFTPEQDNRTNGWLSVMGRLKPEVSVTQANAEMERVAKNLAIEYPSTNAGWSASVEPLQNNFLSREMTVGMWLALGAVGSILLIGCANVANLLLARGATRRREIAIRSSLGAPNRRIFAQFLTESLVLAGIGGGVGIAIALGLLRLILAALPPNTLPSEADVRLNIPVLLFALFATAVAGVLAGCAPAVHAMRANIAETVNETGRTLTGARSVLRRSLVVGEFALAIVLLSGGGVAVGSLAKLTQVELGFDGENLLTASVPLPRERVAPEQLEPFYARLLSKVEAIPGVSSASISTGTPAGAGFRRPFQVVGGPPIDASEPPRAGLNMVSANYFSVFGMAVTEGRAFGRGDTASSSKVAIVNQAFVREHLNGVDPLASRLVIQAPSSAQPGLGIEVEIVGVIRDIRNRGPRQRPAPEIHVPFSQSPWSGTVLAVRTSVPPDRLRREIAAAVQAVDPDLPTNDLRTMNETLSNYLAGDRFRAFLFGGFAFLALALATAGVYGVMSFGVAQRTQEIGLRMALGASRRVVLRQVLGEGMMTACLGSALGALGAFLLGQAMRRISADIQVVSPEALTIVAIALLTAALAACLAPALRAASIEPMTALRKG